jgi:hypothetical protein
MSDQVNLRDLLRYKWYPSNSLLSIVGEGIYCFLVTYIMKLLDLVSSRRWYLLKLI